MLTAVLQSLIAPLHPRDTSGGTAQRLVTSGFSVGVDAEVAIMHRLRARPTGETPTASSRSTG